MAASYEVSSSHPDLQTWADDLAAQAQRLQTEISDRKDLLAGVEEKLKLVQRLLELDRAEPSRNTQDSGPLPDEVTNAPAHGGGSVDLADAVAEILGDAGAPMHISKIRETLLSEGITIPGRGDDANIIVKISSDPRFNRTARGTYALAEWGLPSLAKSTRRAKSRKRGSSDDQ